ncbi:MAG: hypothetical protein ED555_10625 [Allomuricauda sp.]|nr:MAG: hypothetical protein ED555_10625 [Allomuricauda sp.]
MIKLFRKIRQQLLSENKFSKYLLYALGEIVLVIIGILIALQINEWNGKKSELSKLKKDLEYVLIDLESDREQLLNLIEQRQKGGESASNFIDKYIQNQEVAYSREHEGLKLILYELRFNRNLNGFEKVEKSELFQTSNFETIRSKMDSYTNQINQLTFDEQRLNYFIEENERQMFANGLHIRIYEHFRVVKSYANDSIPLSNLNWLEQIKNNTPFKAILLRFEDDVYQFLIPGYQKTISAGNELKAEIETYLNNQ